MFVYDGYIVSKLIRDIIFHVKENRSFIYLFFTVILALLSFFNSIKLCVCDESFREKIALISPKGPKSVAQTYFCVHR